MDKNGRTHAQQFIADISAKTQQIIWHIDKHGKIVQGLDSWQRLTGQTPPEIRNMGWLAAVFPGDQQRLIDLIHHVKNHPQSFEIVLQIKRIDEYYQSMLLRGSPIISDDGRSWVGSFIDLTSLGSTTSYHLNNQTSIAQTAMLENLLDSTDIGYIQYDLQANIVYINQGGRQMIGIDLNKNFQSLNVDKRGEFFKARDLNGHFLTKDQWPWIRILHGETLKRSQAVELTIQTLYGRDISVQMHGTPLRDEQNTIQGAILLIRDITYRRQSDLRMQKGMTSLLQIIATLTYVPMANQPNALLHAAISHLIEVLHDALENAAIVITSSIDNIEPLGFIGMTSEVVDAWKDSLIHHTLQSYLNSNDIDHILHGEIVLVTLDPNTADPFTLIGHPVILIAPIPGRHSPCIGNIVIKHGLTDHVFSSQELDLIKAAANIAGALIEREQLILEHETATANIMAAEETTRRMNQFIRITGHEFKTPLSQIKASGQLMRRWVQAEFASLKLDEHQASILDKMNEILRTNDLQVNRLNRMVNDLLDVARLQQDGLTLVLHHVDIFALIAHIVEQHQMAAPNRVFVCALPQNKTCSTFIDRDRILQVISNFISNAVKYSQPDQPILITAELSEPENTVTVAVCDEGIGIDPQILPFIWDLYYQGKESEIQDGSQIGLGLGLFLAKAIIEKHHGMVHVESFPGSGSIFSFTLSVEMVGDC